MSDQRPVHLTTSGPPETVLDAEPAPQLAALEAALALPDEQRRAAVAQVVAHNPRFLDGWARLGELGRDPIESYAAFRVGYHRGPERLAGERLRPLGPPREPGLPPGPRRAAVVGRDHRRGRRAGALRALPAPTRPRLAPDRPLSSAGRPAHPHGIGNRGYLAGV